MNEDKIDTNAYADLALKEARVYVRNYRDQLKVSGEVETALVESFHNRFLGDEFHSVAAEIIGEAIAPAVIAKAKISDGKRNITYLAGALGSKKLLREAAKEGAKSSEMQELHDLVAVSAESDFATHKRKFRDKANISPVPYAQIRPMMHGINIALRQAAEDNNLNIALDDTLAFPDKERLEAGKQRLKVEKESSNLHVYAVALTPQQAYAAATNQSLSMGADEAEKSARNFARAFDAICEVAPNVTLVDKDGQVLYKKRLSVNSEIAVTESDPAKIAVWKASCREPDKGSKWVEFTSGPSTPSGRPPLP
jgi:hypothetical protein